MNATPQLNATLQEIIDHHDIRKLLSVYCHGCDRGDGPRMASVYLEDSCDDHGLYKGPGWEFAKHAMNAFLTDGRRCTHLLGQTLVNVKGDEAGTETYFQAAIRQKDETGQPTVSLLGGRYVDTLLREEGQWKIKDRICVRDWSITLDVNKDVVQTENLKQGQLSGEDPSYGALGLEHPGWPPKS